MSAQGVTTPGRQRPMRPQPETIREYYHGSGKLVGKVALITGGDSGIGRAVAVHFAREGADVAVFYLSEDADARDTQAMVEQEGRRCLKRQAPRWFIWLAFVLLIIGRGAAPYLNTSSRMLAAGIGTGAVLLLIPLLMAQVKKIVDKDPLLVPAQGLALCVGLSILLRTLNYTIDISLTASGGWIGWLLAALLGLSLALLPAKSEPETAVSEKGFTSASVGCVAVLNLMYFAFTSPGVIARWTEGNYPLIVVWVSLFTLLWLFISLSRPELLGRIKPAWLVVWNLLFSLALTGTILAHTVRFPPGPGAPAVVVTAPAWYQQIPLVFMLLLFPVLLIDFAVFTGVIVRACQVRVRGHACGDGRGMGHQQRDSSWRRLRFSTIKQR